MNFGRVITAMVTPFNQDGQVDKYAHTRSDSKGKIKTDQSHIVIQSQSLKEKEIEKRVEKLQLLEAHQHFSQIEEPEPFKGFSDVHSVAIYEIELLLEELNKLKEGQSDHSLEHARRHYENAILSHNLMEREYLSLSEEYGLY